MVELVIASYAASATFVLPHVATTTFLNDEPEGDEDPPDVVATMITMINIIVNNNDYIVHIFFDIQSLCATFKRKFYKLII